MDSLKGMAKGGWHPGGSKGGSSSSSSGGGSSFKGIDQVKGWMGKGGGREDPHDRAANHASTPLNQLRDPASFGPPPKRTGTSSSLSSSTVSSPTASQPPAPVSRLTPSTGGLGAPLSRAQLDEDRRLKQEREDTARRIQEEEEAKPVGPYRVDTTGLSTTGLPPPPKFRGAAGGVASPPPPTRGIAAAPAAPAARAAPPSLPPRLPPRQAASPPPPAYEQSTAADPGRGVMNQGALNRLGAAGVQVHGLGIGSSSHTASPPPASNSQLSELQSRFSRLNSGGGGGGGAASEPTPQPATGTTWAQKQAALRTASNFQKDPSSVSFADARSAASTANNFRERHGEQVAGGWKAANNLNQKYGISDRFNNSSAPNTSEGQTTGVVGGSGAAEAAAKKKAPPPPPPAKKPGLGGGAPPPINYGSRPNLP